MPVTLHHVVKTFFLLYLTQKLNCSENGYNDPATVNEIQKFIEILESKLPTSSKCSKVWTTRYTNFHRHSLKLEAIDISKPSQKLIFVPILSGLADRIVGLSTALIFSILTDRVFQISNRPQLPNLESIFTSPSINWTRPQDPEWLLAPLLDKPQERNYNQTILNIGRYNAVNTIENYKLQDAFLRQNISNILGTNSEVFLSINRGKSIRLFENEHYTSQLKDMGITPNTAFGCMVHYLFTPRPEIFIPVLPELRKLAVAVSSEFSPEQVPLRIGIHIRTGDKHLMGDIDHPQPGLQGYTHHFDCASQIEAFARKPGQEVIWYLLTDSSTLRKEAQQKYGSKVLTSVTNKIEHSSKETSVCAPGADCKVSHLGFKTAAAEWWLLGACQYFVISLWSGYGRSAAMRSLLHDSIYTIRTDRRGRVVPFTCDEKSFTDLENLSYDWSGI